MPNDILSVIKRSLRDAPVFAEHASGLKLRQYQIEAARSIARSVVQDLGLSFVVMFPRQSGKNELQAQIETYLLTLLSQSPAEIVKISPTWKPQSLNAMRRLERVLQKNVLTRSLWCKESGYIFRIGQARIFFLSGAPEANIVGATASTLLQVDEAQDVQIEKFDKDIAPMAASTNATRVFWGTAWSSNTLLARELRAAQAAQAQDGIRRVFRITADDVAAEVPPYGQFVAAQIAKLGRSHPMVRTQFFSEEIDAEGSLFTAQRIALMQGSHQACTSPLQGEAGWGPGQAAFLLDVAGVDENAASAEDIDGLANPSRDSTALTIAQVDLATCDDPLIAAPTYRVLCRFLWTGASQPDLYAAIRSLAEDWQPARIVVDATGIGAGLAGFLDRAFPGKVIPFTFTASSKSQLAWDFLAIVDAGRWKEPARSEADPALSALFFKQLAFIQYQILPGPNKTIRWSVPEGSRDTQSGSLVHDDLVMSSALSGALDALPWAAPGQAIVIPSKDPLKELDHGF
ncbi:MAG: hypothetical protein IT308_07020 [Anaerolineaceae bacterium]|nr:hypothetical protein [Anaerolineaceae bacterium]